jgi:hypothetical protein
VVLVDSSPDLTAMHRNLARCGNPETYPITTNIDNSDFNIVADTNGLVPLPTEYKHGRFS